MFALARIFLALMAETRRAFGGVSSTGAAALTSKDKRAVSIKPAPAFDGRVACNHADSSTGDGAVGREGKGDLSTIADGQVAREMAKNREKQLAQMSGGSRQSYEGKQSRSAVPFN